MGPVSAIVGISGTGPFAWLERLGLAGVSVGNVDGDELEPELLGLGVKALDPVLQHVTLTLTLPTGLTSLARTLSAVLRGHLGTTLALTPAAVTSCGGLRVGAVLVAGHRDADGVVSLGHSHGGEPFIGTGVW